MLDDPLSVSKLLSHETDSGKHGKAPVLELLGLHDLECLRVSGLQAKRIEANVTRGVRITEKSRLGDGDILGLDPADGGTLLLGGTNGDGKKDPERGRDLRQVGDSRARDLRVEEERGSLNLLADKETKDAARVDSLTLSKLK